MTVAPVVIVVFTLQRTRIHPQRRRVESLSAAARIVDDVRRAQRVRPHHLGRAAAIEIERTLATEGQHQCRGLRIRRPRRVAGNAAVDHREIQEPAVMRQADERARIRMSRIALVRAAGADVGTVLNDDRRARYRRVHVAEIHVLPMCNDSAISA